MRLRIDLPFADEPALRRRTPSRVLIGNGYSFFLASLRGGFHMHTAVAIRNPLFFFDTHRGGKPTLMGRMIDELSLIHI